MSTLKPKIVLTDEVLYAVLHSAAKSGLVEAHEKTVDYYLSMKFDEGFEHRALALVVIFDEILIPKMYDEELGPIVPLLEQEGVVQRIPESLETVETLNKTGWGLKRDFDGLGMVLKKTDSIRPLIVDRLIDTEDRLLPEGSKFWPRIENRVGLRREQFYDALIRYASALLNGDHEELRCNALRIALEPYHLKVIENEILHRNRPFTEQSVVDFVLLQTVFHHDHVQLASRCFQRYGAAVATRAYGSLTDEAASPLQAADTFCLMRSVLFEKDRCFPQIESVQHAVRLRKDPNLQAFKKQLHLYQQAISAGNIIDAKSIERDLLAAHSALQTLQGAKTCLNWITYLSVPIGIAGSLVLGDVGLIANISGLALSALSAAGTQTTESQLQDNSWVLIGR